MKYAIRAKELFLVGSDTAPAFTGADLREATHFETQQQALNALQARAVVIGSPMTGASVVGVEETPGETRREVVELEGVVDHYGLKYTLLGYGNLGKLPNGNHVFCDSGLGVALEDARLFDTPLEVSVWATHMGRANGDYTIVGVREVTTEPSFRIVELG